MTVVSRSYCARCGHTEERHDALLGYCVADDGECSCLQFVDEEEALEDALAEGEDIRPLDFDHE